jgi:hypothetical protein
MPADLTPWLTTMGTLDGTKWAPGDGCAGQSNTKSQIYATRE